MEVIIDSKKCVGCGACVKDCVAHNIKIQNHNAQIISNDCIMCGHCVAVCPKNAVTITGCEELPVEQTKTVRLNPDEVLDVIRFRRSVRQFQDRKVPKQVVAQILEAGRLTHTAKNAQDVSFIVVDKTKDEVQADAVKIFRFAQKLGGLFSSMVRRNIINKDFFFFQAPLVIVITAKSQIDASLAAQNMEFVAEANGLGVLYSGFFTMAAKMSHKIKKTLGIKKNERIQITLVMGYPKVRYWRSAPREKLSVRYK